MKIRNIITTSIFVVVTSCFFMQHVKAATFEFAPATGSIPSACSYEVEVMVDTAGAHSNAADIEIHFDPTQITVLDSNPSITGVQVRNGTAYDSYVYNNVDNSSGLIRVAAGSLMGELVGRKTFVGIKFQAKSGASVADFSIYFTGSGNTLDSNVADTSTNLDLLTGVTNGHYTFNSTSCAPDVTPPLISVTEPSGTTFGGMIHIETDLTDEKSGVNVGTFQVVINGTIYTSSNAVITYTGDKFHYSLDVDPNLLINSSSPTMLLFTVRDYAGNLGSKVIYLNFPTPTPTVTVIPTSTPTATPTVTVTTTVTPTATITPTTVPPTCIPVEDETTPTPSITGLPNTGPTTTPSCAYLAIKEKEKATVFNTDSFDSFGLALGKMNAILPIIGLLGLISLILNIQTSFFIVYAIAGLKKWGKKLKNYIGVIYDKETGTEINEAKIILLDIEDKNLSETTPDYHGRYFFDVAPGNYKVMIRTKNFKEIKTIINHAVDGKINMHQLEYKDNRSSFAQWSYRINKIFIRDSLVFTILAYILSLFALVLIPNTVTMIVFGFNTILLLIAILLKFLSARKFDD